MAMAIAPQRETSCVFFEDLVIRNEKGDASGSPPDFPGLGPGGRPGDAAGGRSGDRPAID